MRFEALSRLKGKSWMIGVTLGILGLAVVLTVNMLCATVTFVKPKTPAKDAWALALSEGEQLFNEKKLLGVEKSCAECHMVEGGKLEGVAPTYPKYSETVKKVITFGQRINYCIVATGGDPLSWDSQDLASLAAYISTLEQ